MHLPQHIRLGRGPSSVFASFWRNRTLIARLTRRDVEARYRGSLLGLLWSLAVPLFMLMVYTFVFGVVMKARWSAANPDAGNGEFAVVLFAGLMLFGLFSEVIGRAPGLVLENETYVTKIVFPVYVLPWVAMGRGLFNLAISLVLLLVAQIIVMGPPPPTALLFPLVLAPFVLLVMGLTWFLASLGVFIRDIGHFLSVALSSLMFLSPIFYPLSALPPALRPWLFLNPLTFIVEQFREVVLWGRLPDWQGLGLYAMLGFVCAWMGLQWFLRTQKAFADVI
jgi:lipopolysaccharide transport system permease protein